MTLSELQVFVADLQVNVEKIDGNARAFRSFINEVSSIINGPYAEAINIDAFIAIQTPKYLELLKALEQSTDVIGSDILN